MDNRKRTKPDHEQRDNSPLPYKRFMKQELVESVSSSSNYLSNHFRNENDSDPTSFLKKNDEKHFNNTYQKDPSNSPQKYEETYIPRAIKTSNANNEQTYQTKLIMRKAEKTSENKTQNNKVEPFKQKKKILTSKNIKKEVYNDIGTTRTNPAIIGEPISNYKSNIVVTRGVEFVPVDQYFSRRQEAKVFQHHRAFYSVTLSQSNLAKDDNKFFIIQLLVIQSNPQEFYLFSRWGRVGVVGQMSQNGPLQQKNAIRQYNAKTQGKVKNGGYRIVQMSYDRDQDRQQVNIGQYLTKNSTLPEQVQQLMRLIFDMKMMQTHMREIGYDQKRSPLGLIAKSAIQKGYIALDNILRVLKSDKSQMQKRNELNEHSSQFYSVIPHDFGYMNMKAFVLNSQEKVKQKLQMLASLSQIQIYSNLMSEKVTNDELPDLDIQYSKLKCQIAPLSKDSPMHAILVRYLKNTHAKTHDKYAIQLVDIFSVKRSLEEQNYQKNIGNKMLLWHGSRLTNFVGILSQGLKIAPYEAPSTGYMFGKGIYFADISSKSANYCLPKHNCSGLMLLCQVALGQMNDKFAADYTAHNLPQGKHSTRGVGKFAPCKGQFYEGVFVPNGQLISTGVEQTSLLYNEYTVYNRQQVMCRYLVQVNFVFKK